ncbi:unnamed protein product [Didymodactylos carnosus]|uniref:Ankyrin repeat protein n=1 Tax=Didymodactylos carnosus TaxID=1234261 RepID=A0A814HH98_9BILA|nr:unnamed protein product [Didymodactylos carnosus]CAF1227040.1 unnamed protein product [Didymodactylos carnosus]CAF3780968.1 unnamed protein product [Didymodactylos carnosus]CAF4035108.1 unnamed protein product [Didymodactylos carnosus]
MLVGHADKTIKNQFNKIPYEEAQSGDSKLLLTNKKYYEISSKSIPDLTTITTTTTTNHSEFYLLSCDVKQYLKLMSIEDVNEIQSNDPTALHAAAYYGHLEIIRLLIKYGGDLSIKNKFHKTPHDEAKTEQIKELSERSVNEIASYNNHLFNDCWLVVDKRVIYIAETNRKNKRNI